MFVKLNSTLQTKNLMGLDDETLKKVILDPYYNFLRVPATEELVASKAGEVITIPLGVRLNVNRDYTVVMQPNPELHSFGIVSYNTFHTGESFPELVIRAHKAKELNLEWLAELRLTK